MPGYCIDCGIITNEYGYIPKSGEVPWMHGTCWELRKKFRMESALPTFNTKTGETVNLQLFALRTLAMQQNSTDGHK